MDSLRADHVGAYGYMRNTTPNIDKLANKGIIFKQFIVNGPVTYISLPSMMSSLYPYPINTETQPNDTGNSVSYFYVKNDVKTLPAFFNDHGYKTVAFMNNNINFTNTLKDFSQASIANSYDDQILAKKAIGFIASAKEDNFFIWIHFMSPHLPYRSPFPFNQTFFEDEYYDKSKKIDPIKAFHWDTENKRFHSNQTDFYISNYDGSIRYADEQIGKIIDAVEKNNLDKKTLIIISSDHGETLDERERKFAHGSMYDSEIVSPLVIFNPSSIRNAEVRDSQIQGIDLFPTILDILNMKKPKDVDGKSFLPLIKGESYEERFALIIGPEEFRYFALRSSGWKYVQYGNVSRLYDLKADNLEINNVISMFEEIKPNFPDNYRETIVLLNSTIR